MKEIIKEFEAFHKSVEELKQASEKRTAEEDHEIAGIELNQKGEIK